MSKWFPTSTRHLAPVVAYEKAVATNLIDQVVNAAGVCLNSALEAAANEQQLPNRVFSPQNWVKTKSCLAGIRLAISQYFTMLPSMPNGQAMSQQLRFFVESLKLEPEQFKERWAAD